MKTWVKNTGVMPDLQTDTIVQVLILNGEEITMEFNTFDWSLLGLDTDIEYWREYDFSVG